MARLAAEMAGAVGPRERRSRPRVRRAAAAADARRRRGRRRRAGAAAGARARGLRPRRAGRAPHVAPHAARRCSRVASARRPGWPPGSSASRSRPTAATKRRALGGDDDLVAGEGFWVEVARVDDAAARIRAAVLDRGLRRLRGQRRRRGARPLVGLHPHGLHAPVPPRVAGPALPVPRRELRPGRAPGERPARVAARRRTAATRGRTRSSCPTSSARGSRSRTARSWSGPRRPSPDT